MITTPRSQPPPPTGRVTSGTQTSRPNSPLATTKAQTNAAVGQATPCPTCSHLRDNPTLMEIDPAATSKAKSKKKKARKATQQGPTAPPPLRLTRAHKEPPPQGPLNSGLKW
ncbi:unnamed protein product [Macrosiphum euphorbiae]|uniref:Uncharacterized protein n=1 Tax=Macrosiphum euphorbiae TaxID=13131 RepID=A0AAV0W6R5_9HEMI|nr:unnamed protein product [Macrosiphum euphorbiae]